LSQLTPAQLVERALQAGYITPVQRAECERQREELEKQGKTTTTAELLVEKGFLSAAQIKALTEEIQLPSIGDCTLLEELGAGYMGRCYLVEYGPAKKKLVFKVMHRSLAQDPAVSSSVINLARVAAFVEHPGFPKVYGAEVAAGDLCFVTEHVPGLKLDEFMKKQGRVAAMGAVNLMSHLADTLRVAHKNGIVHRNISPKNILLTPDGSSSILDLGLEKAKPKEFSLLKPGELTLSPIYCSPEHFAWQTDHRSDIFSLGIILYQLITGELPFRGDTTAEVIENIRYRTPADPSKLFPDIKPDIASIAMKMIEKAPEERYQSCEALLSDLRAIKEGRVPSSLKMADAGPRTHQAKKRRLLVPVLIGVAAVAAAAALIVPGLLKKPTARTETGQPAAQAQSTTTIPGTKPEEVPSAEKELEEARKFAAANPDDHKAIQERFQKIKENYKGTEWALQAEIELDKVQSRDVKRYTEALARQKEKAEEAILKNRFADALKAYQKLKDNFPTQQAEKDCKEGEWYVDKKADQAYNDIDKRAREKVERRLYDEAIQLYLTVVNDFGLEKYTKKAQTEIDTLKPLAEKERKAQTAKIDRSKYEAFLGMAGDAVSAIKSFQLDRAKEELEKVADQTKDTELRPMAQELADDLDLLAKLKAKAVARLQETKPKAEMLTSGKITGEIKSVTTDEIVFVSGPAEITKKWTDFRTDELFNILLYGIDKKSGEDRKALGLLALYCGRQKRAEQEFKSAEKLGEDVKFCLDRLAFFTEAVPEVVSGAEASQLLVDARSFIKNQDYYRALFRLVMLRDKFAPVDYATQKQLPQIEDMLTKCLKEVRKAEFDKHLKGGEWVQLLGLDAWKERQGKWEFKAGKLSASNDDTINDAEYLLSIEHAPNYELVAKMNVLKGRGALLRVASNGTNHYDFWLEVQDPKNVGFVYASGKETPDRIFKEHKFERNKVYEVRAVVSTQRIEVFFDGASLVTPNALKFEKAISYGFLVNPKSEAEFTELKLRVLRKQ